MGKGKKEALILLALCLLTGWNLPAQSGSIPLPGSGYGIAKQETPADNLWLPTEWNGYLEDTFNAEYLKARGSLTQLNNLKIRLNTEGTPGEHFRYGLTLIGIANSGDRQFGLTGYLPEIIEDQIPSEYRDAYGYRVKDDEVYLQESYGEFLTDRMTLRFGRHKFYSGTGYAYNPIDLFNRKNPMDPTYETNGQDALMLTLRLDSGAEIEAVARTEDDYRSFDTQVRIKAFYDGWDLAAGLTRYRKQRIDWIDSGAQRQFIWNMISVECSGEVLGMGVYGEAGWVMVDNPKDIGSLSRAGRDHERLLIGVDYTFESQLYLMAEYLRLGHGRKGPADMDLNDRFAYLTGEILSSDKDTLFLGGSYPVTDLMDFSLYAIVNCNENSAILNPWLVWDIRSGWKLSLSMTLPVGNRDGSLGRMDKGGFVRLRYSF